MNEEILLQELMEAREDAHKLYIELKNIVFDHPEIKDHFIEFALKEHEFLIAKM